LPQCSRARWRREAEERYTTDDAIVIE